MAGAAFVAGLRSTEPLRLGRYGAPAAPTPLILDL
jgi:hypothetical protein